VEGRFGQASHKLAATQEMARKMAGIYFRGLNGNLRCADQQSMPPSGLDKGALKK
jgi:hypothetical protein